MKISGLTGVVDSSDDSVLMLSYTEDGGVTFQTRKIRMADLIDDFSFDDLADTDIGALSAGDTLEWDGTNWKAAPKSSVSVGSILGSVSGIVDGGNADNGTVHADLSSFTPGANGSSGHIISSASGVLDGGDVDTSTAHADLKVYEFDSGRLELPRNLDGGNFTAGTGISTTTKVVDGGLFVTA